MPRMTRLTNVITASVTAITIFALAGCQTATPAEVLRTRGNDAFDDGEYEVAAVNYATITDRYPGDADAQYRLGTALLRTGDLRGANDALRIADEARPDDALIADALAETLYRLDDHDRLFAYLQARARADKTANGYLRLAHYASLTGDPDTARTAYDTALTINEGRSVEPYLAAAAFNERLGRLDDAIIRLRQAYRIDPRDERVRESLMRLGEVPGPTLGRPSGAE